MTAKKKHVKSAKTPGENIEEQEISFVNYDDRM